MAWRGPRGAADPQLNTTYWRVTVRNYWINKGLPCARCGRAIDYAGPYYYLIRGRRKLNPRYLVVGHIVSRHEAKRRGWTEAQVNALTNLQPECQHCSWSSGAKDGDRIRRGNQARARRTHTTSRW